MRLTILFFCLVNFLIAQKSDLTGGIIAFNKDDIETAKELIDVAYDKYMIKIETGNQDKPKIMSKFWHYRGQIYLKLGDLDVAIESFLEDVNLNAKGGFQKKSISSLNICAMNCMNKASENYDKAVKLMETDEDSAKNILLESADLFYKTYELMKTPAIGKIDTTSLFYSCVLNSDIDSPKTNAIALEQAQELIKLDPKDERFQLRLLICLEKKGDNNLLISAINSARSHLPSSQAIINREVNFYISVNDQEGLKKSLNNAIESDSNNPFLHFALGTALQSLNENENAANSYLKAIELNPDYFDAHNNLASMYNDEANELIEKMNQLGSSSSDERKYNSYKKKRNSLYDKIIPHLEECIRLEPNNITMLNLLKKMYYSIGDVKNTKRIKSIIDKL